MLTFQWSTPTLSMACACKLLKNKMKYIKKKSNCVLLSPTQKCYSLSLYWWGCGLYNRVCGDKKKKKKKNPNVAATSSHIVAWTPMAMCWWKIFIPPSCHRESTWWMYVVDGGGGKDCSLLLSQYLIPL